MKALRGLACGCSIFTATFVCVPPALAQTSLTGQPAPAGLILPAETQTAVAPAPSVPSFSQLFKSAVTDVRHLPSRGAVIWLGVGAAASMVAHRSDERVSNGFLSSPALDETFESGSTIGSIQVQLAASLGTYTIGRMTGSSTTARIGADLFRAQALSQVMTQAIKITARRTRPDGTSMSFPSGHTSATFASATVLQRHFGWKAGIPAYAVASFVAASRVEAQRHFLSDVAFGAVLGIVAGRSVTVGRGDARFSVAPAVTPGGAAVGFTWVGHK